MFQAEIRTILIVSQFVVLILAGIIALHLGFKAVMRLTRIPNLSRLSLLILAAFAAIGIVGLWKVMASPFGSMEAAQVLPVFLKVGAVLFYLAGFIVYLELQSLLSRGYSLRILVDLLNNGGKARLDSLKELYGGGVGVRGLLAKRLKALVSLRLISLQGNKVESLTPLGKILAIIGSFMRRLLQLELVG